MGLTLPKNRTSSQQENVELLLDGMKAHFSKAYNTVHESHSFFKIGLDDALAAYISRHIDNPLTMVSHSFDTHSKAVREMLETIALHFFRTQKDNILKVYVSNKKGNFLHFYIILNDDTLRNRRPFFSFLKDYEREALSQQFPILFDFIPTAKESFIRKEKEINLEYERTPEESKV